MSEAVPPGQNRKKLYIETVGCQMNLLDSELVVGKLRNEGYELTEDIGEADTILYNTCSVRQHAEDKIYSALGRIRNLKRDKPHISIGVLGCMAQKDQGLILKRATSDRDSRLEWSPFLFSGLRVVSQVSEPVRWCDFSPGDRESPGSAHSRMNLAFLVPLAHDRT